MKSLTKNCVCLEIKWSLEKASNEKGIAMKMTMMKKWAVQVMASLVLFTTACGGGSSAMNNNPNPPVPVDPNPVAGVVQLTPLENGSSTITVPESLLNSSSNPDQVQVFVNGALQGTVNVGNTTSQLRMLTAEATVDADGNVVIELTDLNDQDEITVIIIFEDGTTLTLTAQVSTNGGTQGSTPTVENEAATMAQGYVDLSLRRLEEARDGYCASIEAGSTNSQIAFGCFLSKLLLLPETDTADIILGSLGENPIDVKQDILEAIVDDFETNVAESIFGTGANELDFRMAFDREPSGFDVFRYHRYASLPLNGIFAADLNLRQKFAALAGRLVESQTTASEIQSQILDLKSHFEELEGLIDTVRADSQFTFVIPASLFHTDLNLNVSPNDAKLFAASMKGSLVSLNIFGAYDYGVNPEDVVIEVVGTDDMCLYGGCVGQFIKDFHLERLVADLNGTGETIDGVTVDHQAFLTLIDEQAITGSHDLFLEAVSLARESIIAINGGETSDLLEESLNTTRNLSKVVNMLTELKASAETPGFQNMNSMEVVRYDYLGYGNYTQRTLVIGLDLYEFFTNPPHAGDVTTMDPFIYDSDEDSVKIVELYFKTLLSNVATWTWTTN